VLIASYRVGDETEQRLKAIQSSHDGFEIAERDWELRGPGDLLGTRQAGMPEFRVANLLRDQVLLEEAQRAANEWLEKDPDLTRPESQPLRKVLQHRWANRLELAHVG
jgi:ATP-dependent DNA helicase RecG